MFARAPSENEKGRRLSKDNITFTYDSQGRVIKQSNDLEFFYDHTGVAAVKYRNKMYFYRKDAQGNIIALLDNSGLVVVEYSYDAWGRHTCFDESTINLGVANPFRYRGYYYDVETGLYFLKTRYYDPEIGRFMSIDGIEYLDPESINGLNLYAYCNNNPVMNIDPNGNKWWKKLWRGVVDVCSAVGSFFVTYGAAIGASALAVLGLAVGVVGTIFTGGLLGAVILGAGIGFFSGVAANMAIQVSNSGWANMDFGAAMKSGGIGALVGAASGAISFGFGTIGSFYGQMAGNLLSNMRIAGLALGSAFSYLGGASLFSAIGTGAGYLLGSFVGSALGNELMNNLFGYNPSSQENISESVTGLIMDGIMKFFGKLWGQ
ncbi:MAG: hypothetical protein IJV83_03810 [Clostridia bacterium]|nr:hypothetical protein [Clostridia bacterium]